MALLIMIFIAAVLGTAVVLRCWKAEKDTAYLNDIYYGEEKKHENSQS